MSLADRLRNNKPLRTLVQAVRVASSLDRPARFLRDFVSNSGAKSYKSSRTGHIIVLRPRQDLQVAREHVSKDAYDPPVEVVRALSGRSVAVVDLGANIGLFALSAVHNFGSRCSVIAVEPDPSNVALLQRNIFANQLGAQITVVEAAAGTHVGKAPFLGGLGELSRTAEPGEPTNVDVTTVDAFELARDADFLKIDIEGGEWDLLHDPRLAGLRARAVAMEWHWRRSGTVKPEIEAISLLEQAGYQTRSTGGRGATVGFVWAWRP